MTRILLIPWRKYLQVHTRNGPSQRIGSIFPQSDVDAWYLWVIKRSFHLSITKLTSLQLNIIQFRYFSLNFLKIRCWYVKWHAEHSYVHLNRSTSVSWRFVATSQCGQPWLFASHMNYVLRVCHSCSQQYISVLSCPAGANPVRAL